MIDRREPLEVRSRDLGEVIETAPSQGIHCSLGDLHVLTRHRLPPRLDEPLGRCTGLVDVGVVSASHDHPLRPYQHGRVAHVDKAGAPSGATALADDSKDHSVAEVKNLLRLDLKLRIRADPVLKEATYCGQTLEGAQPHR
jgi:hypothetical protein